MRQPLCHGLLILLLPTAVTATQDKPATPFVDLQGTWQLQFKDADRDYTLRLHFQKSNEQPMLEVSCTADAFNFMARKRIALARKQGKTLLHTLDAQGKIWETIPYELQADTLRLDPVLALKLIETNYVRKPLKERWSKLLKDKREWQRLRPPGP